MRFKPWFPRILFILAGYGSQVVFVAPAAAVTHIRDVVWDKPGPIPSHPQWSGVNVTFEADLTARDRDRGVEFSIDILGIEADHPKLISFLGSLPRDVALDVPAKFDLWFALTCSEVGERIHALSPSGRVTYQVPGLGSETRNLRDIRTNSYDLQSTFGLVIADEHRVPAPNKLAEDALSCAYTARRGSSIGVYFDREGTICQGTIRPGTPGTVYVVAKGGDDHMGIAGAEFRFDGVPSSWRVFAAANPNMIAIGDPFGTGVVTGFSCPEAGDAVVLYTVLVLASEEVPDVRFTIQERSPSSGGLQCPLVVSCNPPYYTLYCVEGGSCTVNAIRNRDCRGRIVNVEPQSWSAVKVLYRN